MYFIYGFSEELVTHRFNMSYFAHG